MNVSDALSNTAVTELDLSRYVSVEDGQTVAQTIEAMNAAGRSCALVLRQDRLAGIFTQRDALMRAIGRPSTWDRPIREEMSTPVRTVDPTASAQDALDVITAWWVRSVPVVDDDSIVGTVSYYDLMRLMAGLVSAQLDGRASEPELSHSLTLVDFTGLPMPPPITVAISDTADIAAHHMRTRAVGSVLVVDDREQLAGVLTEFDLQTKVGCEQEDLTKLTVKDLMSDHPVAVPARSPIVGALQAMAEHEFSHVPLLGETGRPVGVASFRDIAGYLESSLQTLV